MGVLIRYLKAGHGRIRTNNGQVKHKWELGPNTVGMIGVQFNVKNTDETRDVKYVTVHIVCKNMVGDVLGKETFRVEGPLTANKNVSNNNLLNAIGNRLMRNDVTVEKEALWHAQSYCTLEVTGDVIVEYMDGTIEKIDSNTATYDPSAEEGARKIKSFKGFKRSSEGKILGGVCSAIGKRLEVTPWIFRILFILLQPCGFFIYIILCLIFPKE